MPSLDVVIPVKNGMPEIRECIEGLKAQSIAVQRIIAIDSGSTDGTDSYLASEACVDLVRIDPSTFNHGLTRNLGWRRSGADLVFFTVQDARPASSDMLERMAAGFTDDRVRGVCGSQVVCHEPRNNPVEWHRPLDPPQDRRCHLPEPQTFESLPPGEKRDLCAWDNVAAMYRRSALEEVPFRNVSYGEDMLWAADTLRMGGTILYRPSAKVCHFHLEDRQSTLRRALSSLYFRYLHFQYRYPRPQTGLKTIARICRYTLLEQGIPMGRRLGWFRYNLVRRKALREAWDLFDNALRSGGTALDDLYGRWVEKPPIPLKKD